MKPPAFDYDEQIPAGYYDQVYRQGAGVRHCWHALKFRAVAARIGNSRRVLDIGCGPGTFIGNYLDGVDALGVDLSPRQIAYANATYGNVSHRFAARPAASLVEQGETFDAVTMIELIEHLAPGDAVRLLGDARRLLAPGGVLVVTTPNYRSLWPLIELGVNARSSVGYAEQHINKYGRGLLARHLLAAGFRRTTIETVVGLAPFAAALGRGAARAVDRLERAVGHLGMGHLLIAAARG